WGAGTIDLGWAGHLLAWLTLVWLLNLYNFMDGIDGLAAAQACSVLAGGILLTWVTSGEHGFIALLAVAAAAVAAFLWWNRPPAKLFMGDAGSGFLGLVLGLFAISAATETPQL